MFLLTVTLALSAGAGDISPYGLQPSPLPPPPAANRPASPYGAIRHDAPPTMPMLPRVLPALPVSRPAPGVRLLPPPVTLPDDALIVPPVPRLPSSNGP
jgi:hypothetical protein